MNKPKTNYLTVLCIFSIVFIQTASFLIVPENSHSWLLTIIVWFFGLFIVRRSIPMLIFYGFVFSYLFVPYYFFIGGKIISGYSTQFHDVYLLNKISVINSLFIASMSCMLLGINDRTLIKISMWTRGNSIVFYLSLLLIIPLITFGASGESILNGGYGNSVASKSAIYEYVAVLFIIPLLYYEKKAIQTFCLVLVISYYVGKTLLYGSRLELIQLGLLLFFYISDYARMISRAKLILMFSIGILVVKILGDIRGNPLAFVESITSMSSFISYLVTEDNGPYLMSNSGDVYYASMRLLGLIDIGVLDIEYRTISFFSFIFNLPLSMSDFKNYSTLSSFKSDVYRTGGGGLISVYFYVWFGYIGVLLSGLAVGYVFKKFHSNGSLFFRIYGLSILITFPRWFPYSPIGFVKVSIILAIIYYFSLAFSREVRKVRGNYLP